MWRTWFHMYALSPYTATRDEAHTLILHSLWLRGVNLVWNRGGHGFGFENWEVVGPQMEARSTGLRVSSAEFVFNYTQIIRFLKSHHFARCSHLIFLYIIGYNNISWIPHDPLIPKLGVVIPQSPQDWCLWIGYYVIHNSSVVPISGNQWPFSVFLML